MLYVVDSSDARYDNQKNQSSSGTRLFSRPFREAGLGPAENVRPLLGYGACKR